MDVVLAVAIMILCLLMEAFFSGSEIGIVSADPMRLRLAAAKGSGGARLALKMLAKPEWLLATTLVGTNIAVVTNTTVATALMISLLGPYGSFAAIAIVAPLIWVFGEIVPKSIFQQKADVITLRAIYPLYAASIVFWPILVVFTSITRLLSRLVGGTSKNPFDLRDELRTMMQMPPTEGDIDPREQAMIRQLFDFGETTAEQVMTPWLQVTTIPEDATVGAATEAALEHGHHVLPVHSERVDRVVGVVETLELIGEDPSAAIEPYVRQVDYVPESRSIRDLLSDIRSGAPNMSVVVDEVGGAQGLIVLKDIVEEVTDEIRDEFDAQLPPVPLIREVGEREYVVSARTELDDLQTETGLDLPRGDYATVAGYLLERVQDIPEVGETLELSDVSFTILRGSARRIEEVRIRW